MLEEGLTKLGLDTAAMGSAVKLLTRYVEEIELFNPAYGLVKVQDRRELLVKHILDSLAPLKIIRRLLDGRPCDAENAPCRKIPAIADVGSGAGLPGIPLAICMPAAEFTLIERMGRRAGFLRNTLAMLALPNVRVEEAEMEKAAGGRFDLLVFRAFRPLEPAILKGLCRLLAPGGIIAAYKGRRESVEEEMARLLGDVPPKERFNRELITREILPWELIPWEIIPLEVPFLEEERHLFVIRPQAHKDSSSHGSLLPYGSLP